MQLLQQLVICINFHKVSINLSGVPFAFDTALSEETFQLSANRAFSVCGQKGKLIIMALVGRKDRIEMSCSQKWPKAT